jgi:hypothetical protein
MLEGILNSAAVERADIRRMSLRWLVVILLVSASTSIGSANTVPDPSPDYKVKAIFLFNFAQFVDWPAGAFSDPKSVLVIGVLGDDPFGSYLDQTVKGEIVNGHNLEVRRFKTVEEIQTCHILFISPSIKSDKLEKALQHLAGQNILTVGDAPQFAKLGGMIRFITENSKIRIRINLDVVKAANLTVSAKLLKLAEVVTNKTQ